MTWSAGITSRIGSPSSAAASAASVSAGAVLRPTGSSTICGRRTPIWRSCSAMMKRYSSLVTSSGRGSTSTAAKPFRRAAVSCNSEWSPVSGSSCLG